MSNCVGVITSKMVLLRDGIAFLVMILDATGRIVCSQLICQAPGPFWGILIGEPLNEFFRRNAPHFPTASGFSRRPKFIGGDFCNSRRNPMLANDLYPGHFNSSDIELGVRLERMFDVVMKERFPNESFDYPEMNESRELCMGLVNGKMHNFLMEQSPTYGNVFKGLVGRKDNGSKCSIS